MHYDPLDPIIRIKNEISLIKQNEQDTVLNDLQRSRYKFDLLDLLWYLEDALAECSEYEWEVEWYNEREKTKFLKKLGGNKIYKEF